MGLVCIQNSSLLVYSKSQKVSVSYCLPFQHSRGKNQSVGGFRPPPGLFRVKTKPLNTQNQWIILTLILAVAGFCLVSLDVKEKYTNQSHESIMRAKKSILLLFSWTSMVCKLEIKINLSKSKVKLHPYSKSISTTKCEISPLLKINMHHQMWN